VRRNTGACKLPSPAACHAGVPGGLTAEHPNLSSPPSTALQVHHGQQRGAPHSPLTRRPLQVCSQRGSRGRSPSQRQLCMCPCPSNTGAMQTHSSMSSLDTVAMSPVRPLDTSAPAVWPSALQ
jgi:hypothetical protein